MILVRTPFRVSFAGGFSDVVAQHVGGRAQVLSCTVQLYSSILVATHEDDGVVASYSQVERVERVEHLRNSLFRAAIEACGVAGGIQVHSISRLPLAACGLGGSGAACVGLVNALHLMRSTHLAPSTLARTACDVEIKALGRKVGRQDHYAAAYGGLNLIAFDGEEVHVEPQDFDFVRETLADRCLLVPCLPDEAARRDASATLAEQLAAGRVETAARMSSLVGDALRALHAHDPEMVARVVDSGWNLKRSLAVGASTNAADMVIDEARRAGGGAKLCGAGGGGYVFAVFPETSKAAEFAASHPKSIAVRWERSGSCAVYDDWERLGEPRSLGMVT